MFEKVEKASWIRNLVFIVPSFTGVDLGQGLLRVLPVNFHGLVSVVSSYLPLYQAHLTEISTSRSQEKSSMDSVIPFSSGCSSLAEGGATYLYSFLRTLSLKNWFSLKCYIGGFSFYLTIPDNGVATNEFDGETPMLFGVFLHPDVLKVAEGRLISIMLRVICEETVIHESDRPEVLNG